VLSVHFMHGFYKYFFMGSPKWVMLFFTWIAYLSVYTVDTGLWYNIAGIDWCSPSRVWRYRYREVPVPVLWPKYAGTGTGTVKNRVPIFLPVPVPFKLWYRYFSRYRYRSNYGTGFYPGTGTVQIMVLFFSWYRYH